MRTSAATTPTVAGAGGVVGEPGEPCHLRGDHRCDRDQEPVPAARNGHGDRRGEDDHGERGRAPCELRVDCLQPGRQRRAEQADPGHDLGAPAERDHDGDRRDAAGEREREPVRHEVVAGGRGGEARVATCDPGADGAERRLHLAVAMADHEAGADRERRDDGADENAHPGRDPAAVGGEDEEQDDAERGDGAADDREAARAEQVPLARQVGEAAPRLSRLG